MNPGTVLTISLYLHQHGAQVRGLLLDVYADVYANETDQPFFALDAFASRLDGHISHPNWACVIGTIGSETAGYAYGRPDSDRDWSGVTDADENVAAFGTGTFGLCEIMVREKYRGTGIARALHTELMADRPEVRASLLVEQSHPRVRETYQRWGYRAVGTLRPSPDAPRYEAMILDLR